VLLLQEPIFEVSVMPNITPGESPLVVFVSSVMNNEMADVRREALEALQTYPYIQPWLFEHVPGSSEPTREGYLRRVRESDLVIWLCGSTTTEPVRDEIHEAISHNRPIIVIRLPAQNRDQLTQSLLHEMSARARYCNVERAGSVGTSVKLTINDEIVRNFRGRQTISRLAWLALLEETSKARCVASWIATGLSHEQALTLTQDETIGAPRTEYEATPGSIRVITAGMGSGKSLILERIHQKAIRLYGEDSRAPFPIYLTADSIEGRLRDKVIAECGGFGNPERQGVNLVIDRADALGVGRSSELLYESRVLTGSWPATSVVIASRTAPPTSNEEDIGVIPSLTDEEGKSLVALAWGERVEPVHDYVWPASVRAAIRRPLFALLLGSHLRRNQGIPESSGELVASLARLALANVEHPSEVESLLQRLAVASMDRGGGVVPSTEIFSHSDLARLTDTGLVLVNRDSTVGFILPVFAEWFAALGLSSELISINEISLDRSRLEKWRDALVVAVSSLSQTVASRLLSPLAEREPAYASAVLSEASRQWWLERIAALPALECGRLVRNSMKSWITGIRELATLIAPLGTDHSLLPIVAHVEGESLTTAWAENGADSEILTPSSASEFANLRRWRGAMFSARPGSIPAWPWKWAKEELVRNLANLIRVKGLPSNAESLIRENNWTASQILLRRGSLNNDPIPIVEIEERLSVIPHETVVHNNKMIWLGPLRQELTRLHNSGEVDLTTPWPAQDCELAGNWIWSGYSEPQTLARAQAVYGAAVEIYSETVDKWFSRFNWQLFTAAVLPARLTGSVETGNPPGITWHFDPLPSGSSNSVQLHLGEPIDRPDLEALYRNFQTLRPTSSSLGFHSTSEVLRVWDSAPATELAYQWLEHDLKQVGWL